MKLAATEYGSGPALVVLHGLFGSGRNWAGLAKHFADTRRVITVDARNHGASPWSDDMSYTAMAGDLLELIDAMRLDRPVVLGHSMGGKTAMTAALLGPGAIGGLIVADIAPAAYAHSHADLVAAMQAVDLSRIGRRVDADAALSAVEPVQAMRDFLLQNLTFAASGAQWRINLAAIGRNMPALVGWSDPPGATPFAGPSLFVHGERSGYVRPEHHGTVRRLFPRAQFMSIAGAGHWLHADRPTEFVAAVEEFLASMG